MTKEQEEAIKRVSKILELEVTPFNNSKSVLISKKDIETVLSMLKEKDKEIEKKDKQINFMANFINDNTPYTKDTKELENEEGIRTVDFTVKYFERKATNNG